MDDEAKNIPVKPDTASKLYARKSMDDTWDDVVRRLIDDGGDP